MLCGGSTSGVRERKWNGGWGLGSSRIAAGGVEQAARDRPVGLGDGFAARGLLKISFWIRILSFCRRRHRAEGDRFY
jgi:hypothetical protein